MWWNGEAFIFEQLKDGGWRLVRTARERVMDFSLAGSLVTMQHTHMFPEFPTSRAAVRFGVFLQIFNVGEMALVKVKVEGTWIVTKRSMDQLSGNLFLVSLGSSSSFSSPSCLVGSNAYTKMLTSYRCSRSISSFSFTPQNFFFSGKNSRYFS